MHIKKGDKVIITTGKDRGKSGEVVRALPKESKVVVDGLNMATKHRKARAGGKGELLQIIRPLHVSNVKKVETTAQKQPRKKSETKGKKS